MLALKFYFIGEFYDQEDFYEKVFFYNSNLCCTY